MSKKIAEGTGALVLDVKAGSGAFMKNVGDARELARTMVGIGSDHGVNTVALLTAMDTPLGLAVGNAVEVAESVEVLGGGGPADVVELTVALAREMLAAVGLTGAKDPAEALRDGSAMDVWRSMISAQGGDPDAALPVANETCQVTAPATGVLTRLDAYGVGVAAWRLGGRPRPQGGPGVARGGHHVAREAGRPRPRGRAAADPARGHGRPLRPGFGGVGGRVRGRRGVHPAPTDHRPHRLRT